MPSLGWSLFLLAWIQAQATLDQYGHAMLITYDIQQPSRAQAVSRVDIWFHVKGRSYQVATHRYSTPVTSLSDTFPWFSQSKWQGGDLELVFHTVDGTRVSRKIPEGALQVRDLGHLLPSAEEKPGRRVNWARVKTYEGPDPYAWRMLGYDPEHTGYYPFSLYPPLEMKWILDEWGHPGSWIPEVSGAAGHNMLFIPKSVSQWNIITARDIETGEIIWERYVTANAMTSALSIGDSILFVGTWIGFTPWQDTTFYALDPFTGELKWGKVLKTVEWSPIVVDTFVYPPHFYKVYCFTYSGDSVWAANGGCEFSSPVYEDGIIIGAANDTVLNARDYLTGDLIWDFTGSGNVFNLMAYEGKVIFSPWFDPLYALDSQTGDLLWTNWDYGSSNNVPLNARYSKIFWGHGLYVGDTIFSIFKVVSSINGEFLWGTLLPPADTNGGRMTRIVISPDSMLWVANKDILYILKADYPEVIYSLILPNSPAQFSSWSFPIAYRNYFIYAHEDFLVVYAADTVMDAPEQGDTLRHIRIYPFYKNGNLTLRLDMPEGGQIRLALFSSTGRRVWEKRNYLAKGSSLLNFPPFPSGVYLLAYEFRESRGARKVLFLKQGAR